MAGVSYSAAGSLPGGSFGYTYEDDTLRPIQVFGQGMTSSTSYSLTGKPLVQQMGLTSGGKKTQVTNSYEWGTQRLANTRVDREEQAGVDRSVSYRYDEAGNVLSMSDVSRTGTDNQCFTYDWAARLTEAWTQSTTDCASAPGSNVIGGPAPYWLSYGYDQLGNRKTETQHNTAGDASKDVKREYAYFGQGKPQAHALSAVTTTDSSGTKKASYGYDETGNTTTRPGQSLTWDLEGHLAKVVENGQTTAEYLYDADGSRLISRTATETTLYLGHTEVTLSKGADKPKATRYIDLGGGQTAIRNDDGTFAFTVGDNQGTGQLAVQAADLSIAQRRTLPFGAARGSAPKSWPGTKGFVGGTDDSKSTGLTHLGAREYDPVTGRFLSVDPLIEPTTPQSLNGYGYSVNNPVTASDPTGLSHQISCEGASCDGEMRFKESHNAPNLFEGETWESKYPWETSHYDYFDPNAHYCDSQCEAQFNQIFESPAPIITVGQCGSTTGGKSCPGVSTPGELRAASVLLTLDPTGALAAAGCIQNPNMSECAWAGAAAVPIFGKTFKGGKVLLEGIEGLDRVPKKLPRELDFPEFPEGKTASYADGQFHVSGYGEKVPKGFTRPPLDEINETFPGSRHPNFRDNHAGDGAYYLSHAEKQAATMSPGSPIVVTKPMCDHCFQSFTDLARNTGQPNWVLDPSGLYMFRPQ